MSDTQHPDFSDRLIDLLVAQTTETDGSFNQSELIESELNDSDYDLYDEAAAAIDIAAAMSDPIEMPASLMDTLLSQVPQAPSNVAEPKAPSLKLTEPLPVQSPSSNTQRPEIIAKLSWIPWTVAAASVLLTLTILLSPNQSATVPTLAQARLALIENSTPESMVQWDWIVTEDPANAAGVTGDVVWNDELNKGYMRISGLEINNPTESQYQLWIFDSTRPTDALPIHGEGLLSQRPIDGGVFDINEAGEVIIEIDAKLLVKNAAAFAVTVEPPGGVVVSDRSRVPLLALAQ
jgi:anti-sigma-K factor RskA